MQVLQDPFQNVQYLIFTNFQQKIILVGNPSLSLLGCVLQMEVFGLVQIGVILLFMQTKIEKKLSEKKLGFLLIYLSLKTPIHVYKNCESEFMSNPNPFF